MSDLESITADIKEMIKVGCEGKTLNEFFAEYEWIAAKEIRKVMGNLAPYSAETRMDNEFNTALVTLVVTGVMKSPNYAPSNYEIVGVMNYYKIAPPHVKEIIGPYVSEWKAKSFKSPDIMEQICVV